MRAPCRDDRVSRQALYIRPMPHRLAPAGGAGTSPALAVGGPRRSPVRRRRVDRARWQRGQPARLSAPPSSAPSRTAARRSCSSACGRPRAPPSPASALDRPRIMGVVNVTPDSFSDGGRYCDHRRRHRARAAARGRGRRHPRHRRRVDAARLRARGPRGGVPARPAGHRRARRRRSAPALSIDTRKAEVMRRAAPRGRGTSSTTSRR